MFDYPNFRHLILHERTFSIEAIHKINLPFNRYCTEGESVQSGGNQDGWEVSESVGRRTVCCHIDLFTIFSTFDVDKFRKIRRHHSKECLKISKITKFEHNLLKTNEDTPPQSCKILQTFVC